MKKNNENKIINYIKYINFLILTKLHTLKTSGNIFVKKHKSEQRLERVIWVVMQFFSVKVKYQVHSKNN